MAALTMAEDHLNDLFRTLGRVEEKVDQATAQNADIKAHLKRQDELTELNKNAAIEARRQKDERDQAQFKAIQEAQTVTSGRLTTVEKRMDEDVQPVVDWHRDEGSKLGGRVSTIEQHLVIQAKIKAEQDGENRGRAWVYAKIGALILAIGGVLGWLGLDKVSAALFRIAVALGGGHG